MHYQADVLSRVKKDWSEVGKNHMTAVSVFLVSED